MQVVRSVNWKSNDFFSQIIYNTLNVSYSSVCIVLLSLPSQTSLWIEVLTSNDSYRPSVLMEGASMFMRIWQDHKVVKGTPLKKASVTRKLLVHILSQKVFSWTCVTKLLLVHSLVTWFAYSLTNICAGCLGQTAPLENLNIFRGELKWTKVLRDYAVYQNRNEQVVKISRVI